MIEIYIIGNLAANHLHAYVELLGPYYQLAGGYDFRNKQAVNELFFDIEKILAWSA